jgi:hypothetical protein
MQGVLRLRAAMLASALKDEALGGVRRCGGESGEVKEWLGS